MTKRTDFTTTGEDLYCNRFRLHRQPRGTDVVPAIIKEPASGPLASSLVAELQNEFTLTARLSSVQGVRQALRMEGSQLFLTYVPGKSLRQHIQHASLDLGRKLQIAADLASILHEIHTRFVIHRGVSSANILIAEDGAVYLIDFGMARMGESDGADLASPDELPAEMLAYIAPEQTGRMNRPIDFRTDLYSLGVVLYELFTGALPFQFDSAASLLHAHLARYPVAPDEIDPSTPGMIALIILKLLAKDADDRYRTAHGLLNDLQICVEQWRAMGAIQPFELAHEDVSRRLQFPSTLYGRNAERAQLQTVVDKVADGDFQFLLVSGDAGVGKTALVHELRGMVTRIQGYFVEGKFDQYQHTTPFSAWTQAFTDLLDRWMTENQAQIQRRRLAILDAVGISGQTLVERITGLASLIGAQPPAPELDPDAARRRLNYLFSRFIEALCSPTEPLDIYLDDLQWVDPASIDLLRTLVQAQIPGLLLVGGYRASDVDEDHPLSTVLDSLDSASQFVCALHLEPLAAEPISELLSDVLALPSGDLQLLAQELKGRSGGNIFYLRQLLLTMTADSVLWFDDRHQRWLWDVNRLAEIPLSDSVASLLTANFQRLPPSTVELLGIASCLGAQVDLDRLGDVAEMSQRAMWLTLLPAVRERMIFFGDNSLRFGHDRIQQTAYRLIPEGERASLHRRIGRHLLANSPHMPMNDRMFDAVDHLNLSVALIDDDSERLELARLNRDAADQGMRATAFAAALDYAQRAIDLLGGRGWQSEYQLQLHLHLLAAEAAYLVADYSLSDRYIDTVLALARTEIDKAHAYDVRIRIHNVEHRIDLAVETGIEALQGLGVTLAHIELQGLSDEAVRRLPTMTDPGALAVVRIIAACIHPVYVARPELLLAMVSTAVDQTLKFGLSPAGCLALGAYAAALLWYQDMDKAYRLSQVALTSLERFDDKSYLCQTKTAFDAYMSPWKTHLSTVHEAVQESVRLGLEHGNRNYVGTNLLNDTFLHALMADDLGHAYQEMKHAIERLERVRPGYRSYDAYLWTQYVANLHGDVEVDRHAPLHFAGPHFDESVDLDEAEQHNLHNTIFYYHALKCSLSYHLGEYEMAHDHAQRAAPLARLAASHFNIHLPVYYHSLTLLQLGNGEGAQFEQLDAHIDTLRLWSEHAPMNYAHKLDLVLAERARVLNNRAAAMDHYEQAIAGAAQNGFVQDEALANELYGRYWLKRGNRKIAQLYIAEAYALYRRWGASAITAHLESLYPNWLAATPDAADSTLPSIVDGGKSFGSLDLRTIMDAAEAIAGARGQAQLVQTMLSIIMANAGAERVYLLINHDDEWVVDAQAEAGANHIQTNLRDAVAEHDMIAAAVVHYVAHTSQTVLLDDAVFSGQFVYDPVIQRRQVRSLLALPLIHRGKPNAILYLENNLAPYVFAPKRVQLLQLLSGQMAISIEQSRLNDYLEAEIVARTQELSFTEEQVRALFEHSPIGIGLTTREGRILTVNPALLEMTGYDEEGILQRSVADFYVDPDRQSQLLEKLSTAGTANNVPVNIRRKDGSWFYANLNISTVIRKQQTLLLATIEDVTDQKRAEEALRTSQRFIQSSLDALSANIAILDADGLIVGLNGAWRRFAEENRMAWPDHGLGRNYLEVLDAVRGNDAEGARNAATGIRSVMATVLDYFEMEYACRNLYEERWYIMRVTRFEYENGMRLVIAHEDVTERKLGEAQRTASAVYDERTRLARELHDSVTQTLYSLDLFANATQQALIADKVEVAVDHTKQIRTLSQQALADMRRLLFELRPPVLEEMGIEDALRSRLEMVEARAGIETSFESDVAGPMSAEVESELYAIALEALNNSLKHGGATRIRLVLTCDGQHYSLAVQDDGVGFDVDAAALGGGHGLGNMHERAEQIDGVLTIHSSPGSGVTIQVEATR